MKNWQLTVLVTLALSITAWFQAPTPSAPHPPKKRKEAWQLPAAPQQNPEKSVVTLTSHNLWGIIAAASDVALNPPEWRVSGVTNNGKENTVLVSTAGKPVQFLKEGDTLPGGAKILKIHEDRICITLNGKKRTLALFQ